MRVDLDRTLVKTAFASVLFKPDWIRIAYGWPPNATPCLETGSRFNPSPKTRVESTVLGTYAPLYSDDGLAPNPTVCGEHAKWVLDLNGWKQSKLLLCE